jgi:uroporphyrinogen-III synthase
MADSDDPPADDPSGPAPAVVLLRSADRPDRYVEAFAEAGLRAACEPVLAFRFPNQETLIDRLSAADRYSGLVVTSPRAVQALAKAFDERPDLHRAWEQATAFAVGPKTAGDLRLLSLAPAGEEAGGAEALADEIVRRWTPGTGPLLFLAGNRRRDALPDALDAAGVPAEEVTVYHTHLRTALAIPGGAEWLAFFSPSGVEAVQKAEAVDPGAFRRAAIGPTTAEALEEAGLSADAVAATPSPTGLVDAVTGAAPAA